MGAWGNKPLAHGRRPEAAADLSRERRRRFTGIGSSDEGFPFYCGWYENGQLSHTNTGGGLHTAGEWTVYVFATEGDQMNENFDAAIASFTITVR